jgi:DNA-binding NtrC family response regulator
MTASSSPAAGSRRSLALIADEEAAIRALVGRIVTEFDLIPVPAGNELAALGVVQAYRADLACAIIGSLMPSMDIVAIANAIQQLAPELPLILMSGTPPALPPGQPPLQLFGFLLKPFIIADLRDMLRRVVQHSP